jgi:hypothetical protein
MSVQVQLAIERGLARLTLNSPGKLNAISARW